MLLLAMFCPHAAFGVARLARREYRQHLHAQEELSQLSDCGGASDGRPSSCSDRVAVNFFGKTSWVFPRVSMHVVVIGCRRDEWHIFSLGALPVICSLCYLVLGGNRQDYGRELSLGEFFALASYISMMQTRVYMLSSCISNVATGFGQLWADVGNLKAKLNLRTKRGAVNFSQPLLEIKSLSFAYDKHHVVSFLNLCMMERDWVGIAGALGTGKTTILRCVLGLLPVADKKIFLFGTDINSVPDKVRSNLVSYVPQKVFLFSTTIRENLCLDQHEEEKKLWQVLEVVQLHEFIASLPQQLDTKIGEWGVDLSGGQIAAVGDWSGDFAQTEVVVV